jgi:fluoroacetyl-CoA thioesterase
MRSEGSLTPGIERQEEFTVEDGMLTDVGGTLGVRVLSTPAMIGVMERNSARLAREQLDERHATVGFEVCVRHVAGAGEGTRCVAYAALREVVDGRKLRFDVEVRALDGDGSQRTIGVGTHERRVIDVAAHAAATERAQAP